MKFLFSFITLTSHSLFVRIIEEQLLKMYGYCGTRTQNINNNSRIPTFTLATPPRFLHVSTRIFVAQRLLLLTSTNKPTFDCLKWAKNGYHSLGYFSLPQRDFTPKVFVSFRVLCSWDWVSITNYGEKNNIFDDDFWTTLVGIHKMKTTRLCTICITSMATIVVNFRWK